MEMCGEDNSRSIALPNWIHYKKKRKEGRLVGWCLYDKEDKSIGQNLSSRRTHFWWAKPFGPIIQTSWLAASHAAESLKLWIGPTCWVRKNSCS
ncbi:hypothetical protein V6N13_011419 [Hibiscus sabdariffa]